MKLINIFYCYFFTYQQNKFKNENGVNDVGNYLHVLNLYW